jgi:uncharacterized protein YbaP (TraB family)
MRFFLLIMVLLMPASLWASCGGIDMRTQLDGAQRAEIAARLDGVPFTNGNHWTATKGDRVIHVIGTMHIDDPRMVALTERLAPVVRSADFLLVEATKEDQAALQREVSTNPELAFLTGKTLIELMPTKDWEALAAAAQARGIPPFMAAKFQPWYLSLLLSMSPCALAEMNAGGHGLDTRLMEIATQADVPMASLEAYTTVFELFAKDPIEEQIEMLTLGVLPDHVSENATATLKAQYFDQEHMSALETSRVVTRPEVNIDPTVFDALYDEFIDLLVRVRNEAWIAPIEATQGKRIVVAAGALHLGGKNGVLNLLAKRGYELERQSF